MLLWQLRQNQLNWNLAGGYDDRNEKIGYKIREAQVNKTPYMLVVGDKEVEANAVGVRHRKEGDLGAMKVDEFIAKALEQIKSYSLD